MGRGDPGVQKSYTKCKSRTGKNVPVGHLDMAGKCPYAEAPRGFEVHVKCFFGRQLGTLQGKQFI